jgi:hypothetical protein
MTLNATCLEFCPFNLPHLKRWLVVLPISILLHFFALHWAGIQLPAPSLRNFNVVHASLHRGEENAVKPAMLAFGPGPHRTAAATPVPGYSAGSLPTKRVPATLPTMQSATATDAQTESTKPANQASVPGRNLFHYRIDLPPAATLVYDVTALKRGVAHQGQSTINWQSDGARYRIIGSTDIDGMAARSFESDGTIDEFGIAPLLYTEQSSNRSATNTHFQRARNLISFSSSTASYPRQGGEQDRASIVWQLAGIGRGSPDRLFPNAALEIFVAGVRDGEAWHIRVLDEEEVEVASGKINALHLVRMPHLGTYDQRLDVWLAPQQVWYPVKWRFTQINGDTVEMSLTKISSGGR